MKDLSALLAGLLFGLGLTVAQMTNPQKVLDFLDITRQWDASLALVMGSALVVAAIGYALRFKMRKPFYATGFNLPRRLKVDRSLILGSILFGVGWGMVGLCPGPAVASLVYATQPLLYFIIAMLIGMFVSKRLQSK
ncbi:DUF6691 family protein [Neptunicella marina]|uniref:YeeE/YedE family protein n=1 Tax=Neptunicella marina TaxID=2125989 RepID=A0A8J6IQK7_9ALTE|nr:DUF6691 family protein [Neptunicella marina]MBC3765106.1 YeeE/YedE family protein [Neptunicella marina]